jgi:predicted DNA-binding transcriptional regulator YafY
LLTVSLGWFSGSIPAARAEEPATAIPPPRTAPAPELVADCLRALRERRVVPFSYRRHERVLEPHALGVAANGEAVLHGYQTEGGTVSGKPLGWRTFSLAEIQALTVTEKSFPGPRPDHASDRPKLNPLWGELEAGR